MAGSKLYFASDFHLGVPTYEQSLVREKRIIRWLDSIQHDAEAVYLMGDIFDFWFEYKHVAPKGYIRFLAKIAALTDAGIPVHAFIGNHDMWMFGYLQHEIGLHIHTQPETLNWNGYALYLAHGDGLGPGDYSYKFIKKIFRSPFFQWVYARFHPNFAIGFANYCSRQSRKANAHADAQFLGNEREWLVQYCHQLVHTTHYDYMIFGHRHLPLNIEIKPGAHYINLGDWIQYNTYAVLDAQHGLTLLKFDE